MPQQAPGKSQRDGLTLIEVITKFGDEESAKAWFTERLWPQGPYCPRCGSLDVREVRHPSMSHRCRDCPGRPLFSLRTGTVMQSSKLNYRTWALAIYLLTTNLKGVSSMKLHRDLGVTQKTAWHLAHRTRAGLKAARAAGKTLGRPSKLDPAKLKAARAMLREPDLTVREIAEQLDVSRSTLYRHFPSGRTHRQ